MFSGKFYNYDSYCSMYEDVFEWILEAFDDLNSMDDLADDLETIKCQVPASKFHSNYVLEKTEIPFYETGVNPTKLVSFFCLCTIKRDHFIALREKA